MSTPIAPLHPVAPAGLTLVARPFPLHRDQRQRCARSLDDCIGLHPGPLARLALSHPLLASALL